MSNKIPEQHDFETESMEEVITQLRKVSLVGFPEVRPYKNSIIKLQTLSTEVIRPTAYYALKENLSRVQRIYSLLKDRDHDLLNLEYSLTLNNYRIIPPILEVHNEQSLVLDGMHRLLFARMMGIENVKVIVIENISIPFISLPLTWQDVQISQDVPAIKRIYNPQISEGQHSKYYRNLSAFGSTGERKSL